MKAQKLLKIARELKRGDLIEILEEDEMNLDIDTSKPSKVWRPYYFDGVTTPYGISRPAIRISGKKYGDGKLKGNLAPAYSVKELEEIFDVRKVVAN